MWPKVENTFYTVLESVFVEWPRGVVKGGGGFISIGGWQWPNVYRIMNGKALIASSDITSPTVSDKGPLH